MRISLSGVQENFYSYSTQNLFLPRMNHCLTKPALIDWSLYVCICEGGGGG